MWLQTQSQLHVTGFGATNTEVKLTDSWSIAWPGTALTEAPCAHRTPVAALQPLSGVLPLKWSLLPPPASGAPQPYRLLSPAQQVPVQSVPAKCQDLSRQAAGNSGWGQSH